MFEESETGLFFSIAQVNALYVNNICVLLSGVCVLLVPFVSSYSGFVAIAVFFGFFVCEYLLLFPTKLFTFHGLYFTFL